jgi:predicted signal transduction protein with EAL and GGDEF domain
MHAFWNSLISHASDKSLFTMALHVCSAGLAVAGADADAESTIRDAGAAVHAAKSLGRNRLEIFGPEVRRAVLTQVDLQSDLDRALVDEEFVLHFQPVFVRVGPLNDLLSKLHLT